MATPKRKPTKKPAKKHISKDRKKKDPTSGQSGPPIELSVGGLNAKEAKVFHLLNGEGAGVRAILTITEIAETCFKSQGKKRSNSWARNSLRRLVQGGLVEKVERGKYRVTDAGRKKLARAA
jgi:hypothetical protein